MSLEIQKEIDELRRMYAEDATQKKFNLLLLGELGTGKTYFMRTARKPVHIDSFDPGGSKCLKEWIDRGEVIVDSRYEKESVEQPHAYSEWYKNFDRRVASGYFSEMGTYLLDSSTTWTMAMLGAFLLAKGGKADALPSWERHYQPQQFDIRKYIRKMMQLPCDFVLTGHLEPHKDDVTGRMVFRYMVTGKYSTIIPTLFDEVWIAQSESGPNGPRYHIRTAGDGTYVARTRIGAEKFKELEEPNIMKLLEKAGRI